MNRDIVADMQLLSLAISRTIQSDYCFYAYRKPFDSDVHFGAAISDFSGIIPECFCITPFDNNSDGVRSIPFALSAADIVADYSIKKRATHDCGLYQFPTHSTTRSEHSEQIRKIKDALSDSPEGKIIASRAILIDRPVGADDAEKIFRILLDKYPSAFCFIFKTPASGLWIGASPEKLATVDNGTVATMSLAGTRKTGSSSTWDEKNLQEQSIVTSYIVTTLKEFGIKAQVSERYVRSAGPVEHLCNDITGRLTQKTMAEKLDFLNKFLFSYSPTPALCGYPKKQAFEIISTTEQHSRAYYGGFCGPLDSADCACFFVNLRSMWIEDKICLYCGGGITVMSDDKLEWEETENKSQTMINCL